MESTQPKKVFRILPSGEREIVLATDLKVGERFVDEVKQQEGIVCEVGDGFVKYQVPGNTLRLDTK
jgi:hypothetical protein